MVANHPTSREITYFYWLLLIVTSLLVLSFPLQIWSVYSSAGHIHGPVHWVFQTWVQVSIRSAEALLSLLTAVALYRRSRIAIFPGLALCVLVLTHGAIEQWYVFRWPSSVLGKLSEMVPGVALVLGSLAIAHFFISLYPKMLKDA